MRGRILPNPGRPGMVNVRGLERKQIARRLHSDERALRKHLTDRGFDISIRPF
jgi:hypothetical protein